MKPERELILLTGRWPKDWMLELENSVLCGKNSADGCETWRMTQTDEKKTGWIPTQEPSPDIKDLLANAYNQLGDKEKNGDGNDK